MADILRKILFLSLLHITITGSAQTVIDTNQRQQTVEGWGVSLCWWAHMCGQWEEAKIDSLIDWLVSPDGLNYNVFRYNIGGGDDPQNRHCALHHMAKGKGIRAEMPGFKTSADSPYDWDADDAQRRIMMKIKQKRPDAIFEAFSNTPPYYMTVSGCCAGTPNPNDDNLRKQYYEAFAHYLVDVCKYYKDSCGIEFATLEPFNEPNTDYWWQGGTQEGCHFKVASQIAFVKVLSPILKASGLKTIISASDETDIKRSLQELQAFIDERESLSLIGQWNTHTYSGDSLERCRMDSLVRITGKRFWMSESGSGGKGIDGNLKMARRLFDDMRLMKPTVWCDWQYVEEKGDQWSMVNASFANHTFHRIKNYYVRRQITSHILQGYTILKTQDSDILAAVSPDGLKLEVVVINNTKNALSRQFKIPGNSYGTMTITRTSSTENHDFIGEKVLNTELFSTEFPAQSITTLSFSK